MTRVYPLKVGAGPLINYTYLIINTVTREALIVDPGYELDTISACIVQTGSRVKGILITHHHADHMQLASELAGAFHAPVFMSGIERDFYDVGCLNLRLLPPDHLFQAGGFEIISYHTPGHTKGSVCFGIDNYLFTGDTLFIEGCGLCSGRGADPVEMYYSLQKLKKCIEPSMSIYPGHCYGIKPGASFEVVLKENIYLHIKEINMFVAFRMRKVQKKIT